MDSSSIEPRVYLSEPSQQHGQFLSRDYADGTRTVAWRAASWETWSPEVEVKAVPVFKAVSA